MVGRRAFLIGAASLLAAPAIVKAGVLMPVRVLVKPNAPRMSLLVWDAITQRWRTHIDLFPTDPYALRPFVDVIGEMRRATVSVGGYNRPKKFVGNREAIKLWDDQVLAMQHAKMPGAPFVERSFYGMPVVQEFPA